MFIRRYILMIMLLVACATVDADDRAALLRGDSCLREYNLAEALTHYKEALAECDRAVVRMRMAECYYRRHDYRQCVGMLSALPPDSLDHDAMRELFFCHKALAQPAQQRQWGERLIERYPMDGEMVAELATSYLIGRQARKALRICSVYWLRDHYNYAVNQVLADTYFVEHEWDLAKYAYKELLEVGDSTYKNLFNLGVCYERQQHLEDARRSFDAAINLSGGQMAGALYHQGVVLNTLGQHDRALQCFEQALPLILPDSAQLYTCYRGMAESHYAQADYAAAAPLFAQALIWWPSSLTTCYYLAICLDATGERASAVARYGEFVSRAEAEKDATDELRQMEADARRRMR